MKIYVCGSWKQSDRIGLVVEALRGEGHEVFDFREHAFQWVKINFQSAPNHAEVRFHPEVREAFKRDAAGLAWAEAAVLVLPAGASSHLEAGFAAGADKPLWVLGSGDRDQAEVMYLWGRYVETIGDLLVELALVRNKHVRYMTDATRAGEAAAG